MLHPTRTAAALVLALSGTMMVAGTAQANDDDKIRRGSCEGSTDWKIKAKPDDGRIEVEGEIDSNQAGQQWQWVLKHNGSVSDRGTRQTTGRSGSFSVERKTVNARGTDHFTFRAQRGSGEVCVARISY